MRLLPMLLLLGGCPKPIAPPEIAAAPSEILSAEQVLAPKLGVERLRGLWWLQPSEAEVDYMQACHVAITGPAGLDAALEGLTDDQRASARSWVRSGARGRHLEPVFAAPDRVVLLVRDGVWMLRVRGYVFEEVDYGAQVLDDSRLKVVRLYPDGTQLEATVTFDGPDRIVVDDAIGTWRWMIGHDGPLHFQRDQ